MKGLVYLTGTKKEPILNRIGIGPEVIQIHNFNCYI